MQPQLFHLRCRLAAATLAFAFTLPCAHAQQQPHPFDPYHPGRYPNPQAQPATPAAAPTSTLPATPPTSLPTNNAQPAAIAGTPTTPAQPNRPRRAQVTFANGLLDVRANDSSLNQILRYISRETGLKITGGVQDERVFGNYGPASTSTILATLLDGTGTNILLLEGNATTPPELILTPRGGGPTPPNPNAPGFDDGEPPVQAQAPQDYAPASNTTTYTNTTRPSGQTSGPQPIPQPLNNVNGSPSNTSPTASTLPTTNSVPLDSVPAPSTTPSTSGIVDAPNPPPPGSTTSTAPAGTLTPEQVAAQLLKLEQQQQQSQPPTNKPQ
jgi:hypothetical protein